MKDHRATKVLFFINLLYLQCLPNYCDIKDDASIPSIQAHKVLHTDASGVRNVPSEQDEVKKVNLDLGNSLKEPVQSNVEYVNSIPQGKDAEKPAQRIGRIIEPLQMSTDENIQLEGDLKSSRSFNEPEVGTVDKLETKDKQVKIIPHEVAASRNAETEPLSSELVSKSHTRKTPEKLSEASMSATSETVKSTKYVADMKLKEVHYASAAESEKLEDGVHQQYDGMPSFDEWKKMMLAEQEKGGQKVPSPTPPGKKISSQKRRRNYSSYECGAKIVAANSEAEGPSRILNELVDEYMLNPCKAKIWFVIELCETVQASQIELANFELFSSCPKDFAVYSSDNFPTRDWVPLGTFSAAELRVLQSFELKQEGFGKFIKIELLSHYGEEHYCPLSVVRIFGTSMVDEYEEMETLATHHDIPDDDLDRLDIPTEDKKSTNIFGSATDAVMNIMKKAAQALGQQTIDEKENETTADSHNVSESKACSVMDSSTDKCKDHPVKSKDTMSHLHNFSVSSTSMHQSLFRLLHRCDQCVSSRIRYYSSAQQHCRFFQAALGPVVFQTLCDWFKEHPLAIAHESPAPGKKDIPSGTFIISPTKSPPPQIMRVPSDSDLPLKNLLNDSLSSISESDQSVTINITTLPHRANKSALVQDKGVLQSSIKPTQTLENGHSSLFNDSIKASPGLSKETIIPSADSVSENLAKISISIPERTEDSVTDKISETATVSGGDYTTVNDILTESEQQQINEFLSDSRSVASDDLPIEIVPATELPPTLKPEEKLDVRNENQGKVEPVIPAGSTTAGQKESVFMRMSNRIKALEINMSLSSQYLQELSQRYRRQMEEMQRAFNRTIGTLNDTARKAAEKDLKQQEVLNSLQLQVANLSETVEFLLNERSSVFRQMIETHVCLMIIEAIIMITIMSLCVRRISAAKQSSPVNRAPVLSPARLSKRRNSADSCSPPIARKVKKRSNSEENLNAEDLLIVEPLPVLLDPILRVKKRNRKRNKGISHSISHPTVQCNNSSSLSTEKRHTHSEGCMLSNIKPKQQHNKLGHACENCDNNICTEIKSTSKERRPNSMPLQNLTNGSVISSAREKGGTLKGKEKFSLKKFLKFQKRDSI